MRTIALLFSGIILTGCATTLPQTRVPTEAEIAQCRVDADNTKTSTLAKAAIWASNIIVFPITLPLGGLIVYPRADYERQSYVYRSCVEQLGYVK